MAALRVPPDPPPEPPEPWPPTSTPPPLEHPASTPTASTEATPTRLVRGLLSTARPSERCCKLLKGASTQCRARAGCERGPMSTQNDGRVAPPIIAAALSPPLAYQC